MPHGLCWALHSKVFLCADLLPFVSKRSSAPGLLGGPALPALSPPAPSIESSLVPLPSGLARHSSELDVAQWPGSLLNSEPANCLEEGGGEKSAPLCLGLGFHYPRLRPTGLVDKGLGVELTQESDATF